MSGPRLVQSNPPQLRVRLAVEPNAQRTATWLRDLIARAHTWKQKQQEKEAA